MNFEWIQSALKNPLHVEGNQGMLQKWLDQQSLQKTLNTISRCGYRLQFLDKYLEDHPDCLLSPLLKHRERFPACPLQNIYGIDPDRFKKKWSGVDPYHMRADFGSSLPNVSLWGYPFFVLTEDQVLLRDCSWDLRCFRKAVDRPPVTREISDRAVILPLHRCRNYYHWVIEVLPRIQLLMDAQLWNRVPIIVPPLQRFQSESLLALGLNPELMIPFNPEIDHFKIKEAIYPSRLGAIRKVSRNSVDWLRDKLSPAVINRNRKIYYSRSGAKTRRVLNEAEFLPELLKRGFEIFTGEDLPFKEQVKIFAEAQVVIAAHGAGLTNALFSAPHTPVLELMGSDYVNPCFGELCDSARLPYSLCVGKPKYAGHYRIEPQYLWAWLDQL